MNRKNISKIIAITLGVLMISSATACSSANSTKPTTPAVFTDEGYQTPSTYNDGSNVYVKTIDNTGYKTKFTDKAGNPNYHFDTEKSEADVITFYDDYFGGLEEVKPKDKKSKAIGYFDKDRKMIIYNLIVWTADNKTNYKMSCELCDTIADSELFEKK